MQTTHDALYIYIKLATQAKKVGRRHKQTFLQRHIDDQEPHGQVLNITNYSRVADQNYNEVSPHTGHDGHHQKNLQTVNAGWVWRKRNPHALLWVP